MISHGRTVGSKPTALRALIYKDRQTQGELKSRLALGNADRIMEV